MRKNAIVPFLLGFLIAGPSALFAKELCLTYDVKTAEVFPAKKGKIEEKVIPSRITVALGNGYFYISDASGKTAYDFKKRRVVYVDEPTRTYSDISLFAGIGARFMEFQRRLYVRDVLSKAPENPKKAKPQSEDLFDIESALGIEKTGVPEVHIAEKGTGERVEYLSGQRVVAECRFSGKALNTSQGSLFEKYLIYGGSLHPRIRRMIAAKGKVPEFLKYSYRDAGRAVTVEMTLAKTSEEPRDIYLVPRGYQKTYGPPGQALTALIASVWEGTNPVKRMTKEEFSKAIDSLISKGNYLDAVLTAVECSLQTDADLVASATKTVTEKGGMANERLRAFFQAVNMKDRADAKKAISKLKSIKRKDLARGYVLDILIADEKMMTGDAEGAASLFLKVLKINPYITGVYKDMGSLLNGMLDAVSGWQCWDTARFLCPGHKSLMAIDEYEKSLEKNFPDFFL